MGRRPEIGNVQLYPDRPLRADDSNGYVLKFYCPIRGTRVRRNCGTRDRREARRILRECRERLLNGQYIESGGAITVAQAQATVRSRLEIALAPSSRTMTWQQCFDHYHHHRRQRGRARSVANSAAKIDIARRILDGQREACGLAADGPIAEYATLPILEQLQDRLLAGDEGRYGNRAPMTANTTMGAVLAFLRYCKRHGWISEIPPVAKLDVDEAMKGRPITAEEFDRLIAAVPDVVGKKQAASWKFVLQILWESAFRVGDVMDFSWDDERRIHPVWPTQTGLYPTLVIPSTQKNKKAQEIPLLPGLQTVMEAASREERHGWVVNPLPLDGHKRLSADWFKPAPEDLASLVHSHSNSAIARACGVSEMAVRKWLRTADIQRDHEATTYKGDIPGRVIAQVRARAEALFVQPAASPDRRLTTEYVGRVISDIGEKAGVVVQQADERAGRRIKYASAHDLRRSCAYRLINAGVSAETLKIILRHKDFKTTERFYGAVREAQSAAFEVHQKLALASKEDKLMQGNEVVPQLNDEEVRKLRALLDTL